MHLDTMSRPVAPMRRRRWAPGSASSGVPTYLEFGRRLRLGRGFKLEMNQACLIPPDRLF